MCAFEVEYEIGKLAHIEEAGNPLHFQRIAGVRRSRRRVPAHLDRSGAAALNAALEGMRGFDCTQIRGTSLRPGDVDPADVKGSGRRDRWQIRLSGLKAVARTGRHSVVESHVILPCIAQQKLMPPGGHRFWLTRYRTIMRNQSFAAPHRHLQGIGCCSSVATPGNEHVPCRRLC